MRFRLPGHSRHVPPHFHGRIRQNANRAVLTGQVRESRTEGFLSALFTGLALVLAAVAVACAVSRPLVVPGLVVCGLGAVAFGALSFALRAMRATVFPIEVGELDAALRRYFGAPPSPVPATVCGAEDEGEQPAERA